jgi:hypothetical protein
MSFYRSQKNNFAPQFPYFSPEKLLFSHKTDFRFIFYKIKSSYAEKKAILVENIKKLVWVVSKKCDFRSHYGSN